MPIFRRFHSTGTQAIVRPYFDGWRIRIELIEVNRSMTIDGLLAPTVERAKHLADREILKHGHVCDDSCNDWTEVLASATA